VVFAHQVDDDLCDWVPFARRLAGPHLRTLAFNFRGVTPSGLPTSDAHRDSFDLDVRGAVSYLRRSGVRHVVLIGASLGGTASIAAAGAVQPPADGVISLSGPAIYPPVNALRVVKRLSMPLLLVVARLDTYAADARRLDRATRPGDAVLRVFPGSDHGVDFLSDPTTSPTVRRLIRRFLARVGD
jgi:pimeloyl-ACP methyl ester carboxylesterase